MNARTIKNTDCAGISQFPDLPDASSFFLYSSSFLNILPYSRIKLLPYRETSKFILKQPKFLFVAFDKLRHRNANNILLSRILS